MIFEEYSEMGVEELLGRVMFFAMLFMDWSVQSSYIVPYQIYCQI